MNMFAHNNRLSPCEKTAKNLVEVRVGCCDINLFSLHCSRMYCIPISILPCLQLIACSIIVIVLANNMISKQIENAKTEQNVQQLLQLDKFVKVLQNESFFTKSCNDNIILPDLHINTTFLNDLLVNRLRSARRKLNKTIICSDWLNVEDYSSLISDIYHFGFRVIANSTVTIWRELFSYVCITKAIENFNAATFDINLQICCNGTMATMLLQKIELHKKLSVEFLNLSSSALSLNINEGNIHNLTATDFLKYLIRVQDQARNRMVSQLIDNWWKITSDSIIEISCLSILIMSSLAILFASKRTGQTVTTIMDKLVSTAARLQTERDESNCLLDRMLPLPVSQQLKLKKEVVAESFDSVTILFTDIVGFTTLSSQSTPMQVIALLNELYNMFDTCVEVHDAYKVETIGDAYMVASGLPIRNGNAHVREIVEVALKLLQRSAHFEIPHRAGEKIRIRTGIHTGSCVAGVVGSKMPRYCLFGDTINTASRMESTGKAGRIHISQTTKDSLKMFYDNYDIEPRSTIEVKGKGVMHTFWLVGKRNLFSIN